MCVCGELRQSIMLSASLKSSVIFLFPDSRLRLLWEGCSRHAARGDAAPGAALAQQSLAPSHPPQSSPHPCPKFQQRIPLDLPGEGGTCPAWLPALLFHRAHLRGCGTQRPLGATCRGRGWCAGENTALGKAGNRRSLLGWSSPTSLSTLVREQRELCL